MKQLWNFYSAEMQRGERKELRVDVLLAIVDWRESIPIPILVSVTYIIIGVV